MVKMREVLIPIDTYHTTAKGTKINIRNGKKYKKTSATIHSTANPKSTAINERNWLVNPSNKSGASWNVCVDEVEAIISIPLDEKSNHSESAVGNTTSIGIEICESGDREKTLKNAIEVTVYVLKKFNLTYKDLKQHYDWNKKNCPRILRDTGRWEWFVNEVRKEMEEEVMRYQKIEEVPKYAKPTIQKLIDKKMLKGNENGLDLSEDMIRMFVINDRAGLYK